MIAHLPPVLPPVNHTWNFASKIFIRVFFPLLVIPLAPDSAYCFQSSGSKDLSKKIDFNRDVRPILADRCFHCHGPDEGSNESGYRLDQRNAALDAIEPGDAKNSELIERITSKDPDIKMPPTESHLSVSKKEISILKKWIDQGAKYDRHWAFKVVPADVQIPSRKPDPWIQNPIDAFTLKMMKENGLRPAPPSEKWRWLRRVSLDLTGLPPTVEQQKQFFADHSDNCYEKVVDQLLKSEDFGKKMAVSWLDTARYADSYGYQADLLSPTWPYRDWVVRSFNANLPYDQFLSWQLAGDLIPNASKEQKLATAFNRLHRQTNEGGSVELEMRTEYVADRVDTFGTAMIGLTLSCARCHDHKFDPISQADYYKTFAYFNSIDEWGMYNDGRHVPTPSLLLPNENQQKRIAKLQNDLDEINRRLDREKEKVREQSSARSKSKELLIKIPSPIASWSFEKSASPVRFQNSQPGGKDLGTGKTTSVTQGRIGKGLRLFGDVSTKANVPKLGLHPWQRFSVSVWVKIPTKLESGILFHNQGGTDAGFYGTVVELNHGKVRFSSIRFWPGNANSVETKNKIPTDRWVHLVLTNDGSATANGMNLYIDGKRDTIIQKNHLVKNPGIGRNDGFFIGQRFRSLGFKNGFIDEIHVFDRPLTDIQSNVLYQKSDSTDPAKNPTKVLAEDSSYFDYIYSTSSSVQKLENERAKAAEALLKARSPVLETMIMKEMTKPRPAYVLERGQYDSMRGPKNLVNRNVIKVLENPEVPSPSNRKELANWLVHPKNPLTARVAVNRFWQEFFGEGLVRTPADFGLQGQLPTHPELLDWLAQDFVKSKWDVKRLCKKIVLSSTYRQSSMVPIEERQRDPENRFLARGPSFRMTAEMIRDSALYTSGLLNNQTGGPPVSPYQPPNLWRENNAMSPGYRQSIGRDLYRRSLYTVWKRTAPQPNMMAFDTTTREFCNVKRSRTNTPAQAMVLLNDPQFVEAARVLAENTLLKFSKSKDEFVNPSIGWIFQKLCSRPPTAKELKILNGLFHHQVRVYRANPEEAKKLFRNGSRKIKLTEKHEHLYAMTIVSQAIMSSDAAIWRR